ncbi:MAG: hypothetical protein L0219_01285, partial [Phycisphaerales bacterium]|nr:hypothetical protein [Phycisphaerales bacterium]
MPAKSLLDTARQTLDTPLGRRKIYSLSAITKSGLGDVTALPYCIKVLLESCLRNLDGFIVTDDHIRQIAKYDARNVVDV